MQDAEKLTPELLQAAMAAPAVCYALRPGLRFWLKPKGWMGHDHCTYEGDHDFVSLADLLKSMNPAPSPAEPMPMEEVATYGASKSESFGD